MGLLILLTGVLITFLLPESFIAKARIKVSPGPDAGPANQLTDAQISAVATKLNLNSAWGRRYAADVVLTDEEVAKIMRSRVTVEPVRNTSLVVTVSAFSERPQEAADLANAFAKELVRGRGELIDMALPATRPFRPNRPLNLALSFFIALGGAMAAGFVIGLAGILLEKKCGIVTVRSV